MDQVVTAVLISTVINVLINWLFSRAFYVNRLSNAEDRIKVNEKAITSMKDEHEASDNRMNRVIGASVAAAMKPLENKIDGIGSQSAEVRDMVARLIGKEPK